jgi:hypothetical protein
MNLFLIWFWKCSKTLCKGSLEGSGRINLIKCPASAGNGESVHPLEHYNNVRLNSAIGYISPKDMLAGHQQEIQVERDRKLEAARQERKNRRQRAG